MNTQALKYLKVAWTICVLIFLAINTHFTVSSNNQKVKETAESFFNEIVTTRAWNAMHGGVYVFVDEKTPPNPYLNVPNRDIYTTDSALLTLINPAYMTRQISELAEENNKIFYHITSNNPIRALNAPDPWEAKALTSFEEGDTMAFERTTFREHNFYRFMAPLMVGESCMQCHAEQGYQPGDVRGGISVSVESAPYLKQLKVQIAAASLLHLLMMIIGLLGITYAQKELSKQFRLSRLKSQQLASHKNRLTESNNQLEELNLQKEKFMSIIAHDLRNPVGAIMGLSEILVEEIETAEVEHKKILITQLHQSAVNTYNLMDNLLTWSRSQQGKMEYHPRKLILNNEIQEVLDIVCSSAESKKIACTANLGSLDNIEVWADKNMLDTILRNLLTNAIKFTPAEGTIEISASELDNKYVEITVRDTGVGMPPDKILNLFKIDKTVSTPGTNNEKGTGLGLMLVKEFVEKNKGTIYVESQLNKGTSIAFTIPKAD